MDRIICGLYESGKYLECVELLKSVSSHHNTNLTVTLQQEICICVCQSLTSILARNPTQLVKSGDDLYSVMNKIKCLGTLNKVLSLETELVAEFNYLWWVFQSKDLLTNDAEVQKTLEIINEGFYRVLGEEVTQSKSYLEEEVMCTINKIIKKLPNQNHKTMLLILEIIIIALLIIVTTFQVKERLEACLDVLHVLLKNIELYVKSAEVDFVENDRCLFKFGWNETSTSVAALNSEIIIEQLAMLQAVVLYLLHDQKNSLQSLNNHKATHFKHLWCYLCAFNSFTSSNEAGSLGFLVKVPSASLSNAMKCRYDILLGRIYSKNGDHLEALKCFKRVRDLDLNVKAALFYLGQEFASCGMSDLMLEAFHDLLKVVQSEQSKPVRLLCFEDILLQRLHPDDEVSKAEAMYLLALSYGLNERFEEASKLYNKFLALHNWYYERDVQSLVRLPTESTALHEAATCSLLSGRTDEAERFCRKAAAAYYKAQDVDHCVLGAKDSTWVHDLVYSQLRFPSPSTPPPTPSYSERDLSSLDEDVIGLCLLAAVQGQGEPYKTTLSTVFGVFSKRLGGGAGGGGQVLIKALAARVCLRVALCQSQDKTKASEEIERMFKRALSCNHGDRDILYHFAEFLLERNRAGEAVKLLRSFCDKTSIVCVEQCEGLTLKYLLRQSVDGGKLEGVMNRARGMLG